MSKKHYHPGKVWPIVKIALGLVRDNPELAENEALLKATLKYNIAELQNPEHCANCGASMLEYIFEFDCLDALLLLEMAREVRKRVTGGLSFTEANQVRIQQLNLATYAMKSRTTQMSKLGLVAKLLGKNGRHVPGTWVITKRGWDALKGRKVPKSVRVWRGSIEEHSNELITLTEAFEGHKSKVEQLIKKNKAPKTDYRTIFADYNPQDWYSVGGTHEGKLF